MTKQPTPYHIRIKAHIRNGHRVESHWRVKAGCKEKARHWALNKRQAPQRPTRPPVPPPPIRNGRNAWGQRVRA